MRNVREALNNLQSYASLAHKRLCELDVLHRDISPGNILLALAENSGKVEVGHEGFLSDFELARVGDEVGVKVYERVASRTKRRRTETRHFLSGSGTGLEAPITVGSSNNSSQKLLDSTP